MSVVANYLLQPMATAPVAAVVAVGAIVYGVLDYFFDIGEKVDEAVGRKSGIW